MSLTKEELDQHIFNKILFEDVEIKLVYDIYNVSWWIGLHEVFEILNLDDDTDPTPVEGSNFDGIGELGEVEYLHYGRLLDYCKCADDKAKGEALYSLVRDAINNLEDAWQKEFESLGIQK